MTPLPYAGASFDIRRTRSAAVNVKQPKGAPVSKVIITTLAALAVSSLLSSAPAAAAEYPWCAQYGGRDGGRNCGFVSYQQCMATISGTGGFCERNQFYTPHRERR